VCRLIHEIKNPADNETWEAVLTANPDKFQALAIGKESFDHKIVFELKGNRIECENDVELLGVIMDYELKFDKHISDICKNASRQLNVLKRIGKYLNRLKYDGQFLLIILNVSSAIELSLRTFSDGNFDKCSSSS
jgi:hypothetical protein